MFNCPKIVDPMQNVISETFVRMNEQRDPDADDYDRFVRRIFFTWGWVDLEWECLFRMAHVRAPNKVLFRILIEDWHNIYLQIWRFKGRPPHDFSILLKYYFERLPEAMSIELCQEAAKLLRKGDNGNEVYEKMVWKDSLSQVEENVSHLKQNLARY